MLFFEDGLERIGEEDYWGRKVDRNASSYWPNVRLRKAARKKILGFIGYPK